MCLMCEEEDLYFLYLERLDRAQMAARGETSPPDPNWLWPTLVAAQTAAPEPATAPRPRPNFVCDTPGE
jgi:hypothetical protein